MFCHYSSYGEYTAAYPTDGMYLLRPKLWTPTQGKAIIGCHGRGGSALQYSPTEPVGAHATALAQAGYLVLGIDHAAINSWGDPNGCRATDDAYAYITGTLGIPGPKVGMIAWSMGADVMFNWAKRNLLKMACAWAFNPGTDIRFWQNAGYTPTYNTRGITVGAYASEINGAYGPSTTAAASGGPWTIPALGGVGITVPLAAGGGKGFADGNRSAGNAAPQATVAAVAFTYTSKDDNNLYGCVSTTGSTIAVANGAAITSAYATQSPGYVPWADAPSYTPANGWTFPVRVCQDSDDLTVPHDMNDDPVNGFVARTGSPNFSLRTPAPTGGHTGSLANVPTSEVVAFFLANL